MTQVGHTSTDAPRFASGSDEPPVITLARAVVEYAAVFPNDLTAQRLGRQARGVLDAYGAACPTCTEAGEA